MKLHVLLGQKKLIEFSFMNIAPCLAKCNSLFLPCFILSSLVTNWKTGIELNRHQVTNLINAGFPTVSLQQQPQQQTQHMITQSTQSSNVKESKVKGHRNNQHQQQQQMIQQQMAPQLMAVAFPGNPQHTSQQQQQLHGQGGQHQLIAAVPATIQGRGANVNNNYNNNSTVWACPACKSSFKSATELQTHLR